MSTDLSVEEPVLQRTAAEGRPRRRVLGPLALALALGALFLLGYLPREQRRATLVAKAEAHAQVPQAVMLAQPKRGKAERTLTLPGNIVGLEETVIYARADGYVVRLLADLGDRVHEGQVLAELDTPEAEQELLQARATLSQSEASLLHAHAKRNQSGATLRRYRALAAGLTSREELDLKETQLQLDDADVHVAEAARNAQRANVERLKWRQAFAKVRAPFAGTITARTTERGSLVSAGRASPLFKLTTLDTVRLFVSVPQARVAATHPGLDAQVQVAEYAARQFAGTVKRTSDSLDASSRTMTVEVHVPNPERKLLPGMYGSVTLTLDSATSPLNVPATALIVGEHGVKLARVDGEGLVHLIAVEVERDRGSEVEIASGLRGDEQIIVNPGPAVQDGSRVRDAAARGGV